ncbi:hypothetical protein FNF27_07566 [Cafeteria roenbergensis]|uniref:Nudix hydrolase domain-containing protein n=1 Tax=Cafeteria roenbergensis TaxID=33653 RepID=A0A5A8DL67_CAFRO|nr:hypothetical protein FNF27_07566 [Cafeteria roenbergensis]
MAAAGTVILEAARAEGAGRCGRILMMFRSPASKFMPSALVFPGGRVDKTDLAWASERKAAFGVADDSLAAVALRRCAAREVFEETGVPLLGSDIGAAPGPSPGAPGAGLRDSRLRVAADPSAFAEELLSLRPGAVGDASAPEAASGLLAAMPVLSRYRTPLFEQRQFDAWFLAATLGPGLDQEAAEAWSRAAGIRVTTPDEILEAHQTGRGRRDDSADEEAAAVVWLSPRRALALQAAGAVMLPPPQWLTLSELAGAVPVPSGVDRGWFAPGEGPGVAALARARQGAVCAAVAAATGAPNSAAGALTPAIRKQLHVAGDSSGGPRRLCMLMPGDEDFDPSRDGEDELTQAMLGAPGPATPGWVGRGSPGARRRVWIDVRETATESERRRLDALRDAALAGPEGLAKGAKERTIGSLPFGALLYSLESVRA